MEYNIEQALKDQYCMFFHPGLSVDQFTPVQTLKTCVEVVNHLIKTYGKDFSVWPEDSLDIILQITRANWIHQQLSVEPIRKPILVHRENNQLIVDCGDTRLMAVGALDHPPKLSVIITVRKELAHEYSHWNPVYTNLDLIRVCGFDEKSSAILFTQTEPNKDWCINWLEIGDSSTKHHLHDTNTAVAMLQEWLRDQPANFYFSTDWICQPIDWVKYQSS